MNIVYSDPGASILIQTPYKQCVHEFSKQEENNLYYSIHYTKVIIYKNFAFRKEIILSIILYTNFYKTNIIPIQNKA